MIKFLEGDVIDCLKSLPDESVHCCVTSPPYWGLRDYGIDGQLGLEETPDEYVANMVEVFREVKRVLRSDGTLWLNLGDSYASSAKESGGHNPKQDSNRGSRTGLKPKDLVGIPWRVALALQADGWWLRSDIIWSKTNPMPESVTDRPTCAHEYVFLLTKSERYFYDREAIKEDCVSGDPTSPRGSRGVINTPNSGLRKQDALGKNTYTGFNDRYRPLAKRNKRDVWTIPIQPFPDAHFAVFPEALVEPCILAGTSEKGCCPKCGAPWERITEKKTVPHPNRWSKTNDGKQTTMNGFTQGGNLGVAQVSSTIGWQPTCSCDTGEVIPCTTLDPFGGSGTVAKVSRDFGRDSIYIDLNSEYVQMAMNRVGKSLFNEIYHEVC